MKYNKLYLKEISEWFKCDSNHGYLSLHPEIEHFEMPKTFYFKYLPERKSIHWAIIKPTQTRQVVIYFIYSYGRIFDKIEVNNIKTAQRLLRKNGFEFSTNRFCPFIPREPIYVQLHCGKKTALYSKGNLWQSVKRNKKHIDKLEKACFKQIIKYYKVAKDIKWSETITPQGTHNKNFVGCLLMAILLLLAIILSLYRF